MRSGRPIHWISLGGEPLTDILRTTPFPWKEIPLERIQPICWSCPEAFFTQGCLEDHRKCFDDRAVCYMLSNTMIRKFQSANPGSDLLAPDTFFSFLLETALGALPARKRHAWPLPAQGLRFLIDTGAARVLLLGGEARRWASLIRELFNAGSDDAIHLECIVPSPDALCEHQRSQFDRVHVADTVRLSEGLWDAIVIAGAVDHWPDADAGDLLETALLRAEYVLVCDTILRDLRADSFWPLILLQSMGRVHARIQQHPEGRERGLFVLSQNDPQNLRRRGAVRQVFDTIFEQNSRTADESVSGPGSSLEQTAEIRQRLPELLAEIGARTLIDAPCGDFNWLKHVDFNFEMYVGIDIVERIISKNRRMYQRDDRLFLNLDILTDPLPKADVIFCRDCLVYLSFEQIHDALKNFQASRSTYLLTTHFTRRSGNTDMATGQWRPLNLQYPPFNFPDPLRVINEKCTEAGGQYADKSLALWRLADVINEKCTKADRTVGPSQKPPGFVL